MTKGTVFCIGGKISMVPLHLFRSAKGSVIFRIGDMTLWFSEEGVFDGPEMKLSGFLVPAYNTVLELLDTAKANVGLPPEDPYFEKGTPGFDSEVASAISLIKATIAEISPEKQKPFQEALASLLASSGKT
jgi:hypothetical protein